MTRSRASDSSSSAPPRAARDRRRRRGAALAIAAALVAGSEATVRGDDAPPDAAEGSASGAAATPAAPASWSFRDDARPIKVVVLAGSIGAWPKQPYARQIAALCPRVEVVNLSKVGEGALALKQRFRDEVARNPKIRTGRRDPAHPDTEHWLIFQGGLNSVGTPEMTNHHIRELFVLAHARGFSVLGLSLTPWGDAADSRWRGAKALEIADKTRKVVDFVVGRSTPEESLGSYVARRSEPGAGWSASERADIGIDLYDSGLRDRSATPADVEAARRELARDPKWRSAHAALDEIARAAALEADARRLSELPRWWLRAELRSFDHIHPNTDGHRIIAESICPALPATWSCQCPPVEVPVAVGRSEPPDARRFPVASTLGRAVGDLGTLAR